MYGVLTLNSFPVQVDFKVRTTSVAEREEKRAMNLYVCVCVRVCAYIYGVLTLNAFLVQVDFKGRTTSVAERDEKWASVWKMHQRITHADEKYR